MEIVHLDIQRYLQKNLFPSRTVLVFPPFNGFRRFLIHKLIEDNFASSEVAAFSIGQDVNRRIVICYKGLIKEGQSNTSPSLSQKTSQNMIEKDRPVKLKSAPAAPVYRPPAARMAETKRSTTPAKPADSKRVRRPDLQVYVPRPKRASYGNEQPRSRSQSSSRTSLDSDSCDKKYKSSNKKEDLISFESCISEQLKIHSSCKLPDKVQVSSTDNKDTVEKTLCLNIGDILSASKTCPPSETDTDINRLSGNITCSSENLSESLTVKDSNTNITTVPASKPEMDIKVPAPEPEMDVNQRLTGQLDCSQTKIDCNVNLSDHEMEVDSHGCDSCLKNKDDTFLEEKSNLKTASKCSDEMPLIVNESKQNNFNDRCTFDEKHVESSLLKQSSPKVEAMETISISSDSVGFESSGSSKSSSESDSRSKDSSSGSESSQNLCNYSLEKTKVKKSNQRRKSHEVLSTEVLVISDSSSSSDSAKTSKYIEKETVNCKKVSNKQEVTKERKIKNSVQRRKSIDPDECDWESLYDDSGECLVPNLMEELTNSLGRVRVTSVDNDYRQYQSIEERTNDGECVIEIYDFPAEFKTTDLFNIFAAYRSKNLQIKWVDDTHALGVFPSPLMADEVLACTLPFVKTRPLRLAIAESRNKARNLVLPALPSLERPKTCTALARRLVTGALGLRLPTSSQEREKERQVLKEAREKRRLEAKQKEAAWEGTLTSGNCV